MLTTLLDILRQQAPLLILMPPLFAVVFIPAVGMLVPRATRAVVLFFAALFVATALHGLWCVIDTGPIPYAMGGWAPPVGIALNLDMLAAFILSVIAVITFLVSIYSTVSVYRELPGREMPFYAVMFVMLLGLTGMVLTADLFNLYVFYEVSSLSAYAMMAMGHRKAAVSAYRYLLMGTVGASFYLLGIGYIYAMTGSLNLQDVATLIGSGPLNPPLALSLVLMVVGVGLKMALFPMHLWLPDAYTYASSTATAIIAPLMTKVSAYVMIRVLFFLHDTRAVERLHLGDAITWLALTGVVWGSVQAIAQKDVKRMLAYSSVAQVGYIGVGLGLGTPLALIGAMLHILNHAVMKCCLFMVTGAAATQTGATRVKGFNGLGRTMPWTFFGFTLAALAMIGIPPTSGFFSKWYLVLGGIQKGSWAVVVIVVASGLLTAVYFFRMLVRIYAPPEGEQVLEAPSEAPWPMLVPLLVLGVSVVLLGYFNSWFINDILQHALPTGMELPDTWHVVERLVEPQAVVAVGAP